MSETKYHLQASGAKAGYWVVCTAKNACRLGGEHVSANEANFRNIEVEAKNEIINLDTLKAELAYLDARTAELYPDLPEGVEIQTSSRLVFNYDALSEEAKEKAFENWLSNHYFEAEIDSIKNTLLEDEGNRIEGFKPQAIMDLNFDVSSNVSFQGELTFTPEEADALIAELSKEDLEELEVYAGYENTEQIKDQLVRGGIAFIHPRRYTEGVYTNTVDFSDSEIVDTKTFQDKIQKQAELYNEAAYTEWEYATSKEYFEEYVVGDEPEFDETGETV